MWHGTTKLENADEYLELMRTVAIPDYSATPGNLGAYALRRDDGMLVHFTMLTFWDSIDSISAFAGEPVESSKYYDFDPKFLIEMAPKAFHYVAYKE